MQCCNMTPVAQAVGVNRIQEAPSIKYPFGSPHLPLKEEKAARVQMVEAALHTLTK